MTDPFNLFSDDDPAEVLLAGMGNRELAGLWAALVPAPRAATVKARCLVEATLIARALLKSNASALKGGPGSEHHGHRGREGQVGGSLPRGAAGGGTRRTETYRAGITSARPGKTREQVEKEMGTFKDDLSKVAQAVDVTLGTGGWEGGEEATWLCRFRNGAPALAVIAKYAKQYNQDAAIVMRAAKEGDPGAAPQQRLIFNQALDEPAMRAVETQLVSGGIGGWTWGDGQDRTHLIVQTIPDWGGNAESGIRVIQGLKDTLSQAGVETQYNQSYATVEIMERGQYDKWIGAG